MESSYRKLIAKRYPANLFQKEIISALKLPSPYVHGNGLRVFNHVSKMPEISIIVPVYNVEAYLRQCMDSLVHQTLQDVEIICVNDGSTDGCAEILSGYAARDRRIRVITQANGGLSAARNTGVGEATAPLVMFCDSDDWYAPTMCEEMFEAMQGGADMAVCEIKEAFEGDWKDTPANFRLPGHGEVQVSDELLLRCAPSACNKIFRREIIEGKGLRFPKGLKFEDSYFYSCYTAHITRICFVPKELYIYRRHMKGIIGTSRRSVDCALDLVQIANLIWRYHVEHDLVKVRIKFLTHFWLGLCKSAYGLIAGDNAAFACVERAAIRFVQQEILSRSDVPSAERERFRLLIARNWVRTSRKWGGLFRVCRKDQSTLNFCRMKNRYYLFGIACWKWSHTYKASSSSLGMR